MGTSMEPMTYVGLVAGVLTTISFLPQAIKTWQTKSTKDISLAMFLSFCVGVVLWIVYGFYTNNLPVFVANSATFLLAFSILVCKLKYG
jgi:MtN3 and saliva related transmembrane protein